MEKESLLFERNPNPMFIYDLDSLRILEANSAAVSKYGYSKEEFLKLTLEDIRPSEDIPILHESISSLDEGVNISRVIRHKAKNGDVFYVQISSQSFPYQDYNSRLVVIHDITEEVNARKEVEEAYQELNHLIETNPLAMIKWNEDFQILEWSERAEEISGYKKDEVLGRSPFRFNLLEAKTEGLLRKRIESIKKGESPKKLETQIKTRRGEMVDIRFHTSALRDSSDQLKSVLTFVEDISETKKAERKLKRQNELIQFVHELSNAIQELERYEPALERTIQKICGFIGWQVGHAYLLSGDGTFASSDIWYFDDPSGYEEIQILSEHIRFSKGKGFLGEVLEKESPLWIKDIDTNDKFIRKRNSGNLNLKSCFAFPVKVGNEISVLLEFFHKESVAPDPTFIEMVGTIEDQLGRILERAQAREDLRLSEQKYRRLFERASDGIFIMKGEKFVDCNKRIEQIFECDREDIIGENPFKFSPEIQPDGTDSRSKGFDKIQKARHGIPQVFEWKHKTQKGNLIDAEISLNKLKLQDGDYILAMVRDITRQKEAERALKQSEELFRNLFLKAPVAISMVNKENRVKMVNRTFEELFGYREEELLDEDIDRFIVPEEEYSDAPKMPAGDILGEHYIKEFKRTARDGKEIDVLVGAIPVYLEGKPLAGFGIYIDISDQKNTQRQLESSLKEKEILLKEIHHRVKNNLAVISALLELQVIKGGEKPDSISGVLKDSLLRIKSMALVHETLYQTEDFSNLRFSSYVQNLIELNVDALEINKRDVSIKYNVEDVDLNINQAVPCALILNEMVSNALKYAFEGRDEGRLIVDLYRSDEKIHLKVEDDGIGLPDNFEELRKHSMGMTLIDQLTTQLHGELTITSSGSGTTFELDFEKKDKKRGSSSHFI